jgi:hypothetical protein
VIHQRGRRKGDALALGFAAASGDVAEVPSFESARVHGTSNLNVFRYGFRVLGTIVLQRLSRRPRRMPPPPPTPVAWPSASFPRYERARIDLLAAMENGRPDARRSPR